MTDATNRRYRFRPTALLIALSAVAAGALVTMTVLVVVAYSNLGDATQRAERATVRIEAEIARVQASRQDVYAYVCRDIEALKAAARASLAELELRAVVAFEPVDCALRIRELTR